MEKIHVDTIPKLLRKSQHKEQAEENNPSKSRNNY